MKGKKRINITLSNIDQMKKVLAKFSKPKTDEEIFYNLCFCLLVPQTTFKKTFQVVEDLKKMDFYWQQQTCSKCLDWSYPDKKFMEWLLATIKPCRFNNTKAQRLLDAKRRFSEILMMVRPLNLESFDKNNASILARLWLVKNVNGLGMKAASHFLRNLGARNLALTHILKFLKLNYRGSKFTDGFKILSYEDVENKLKTMAKKAGVDVAVFDGIIWAKYSGTGYREFVY